MDVFAVDGNSDEENLVVVNDAVPVDCGCSLGDNLPDDAVFDP